MLPLKNEIMHRSSEDNETRRWTYRGVGSDHEIVVCLRESTPTNSIIEKTPSSKADPERLQCANCKRTKPTKDSWWCRTCQKTLCSSCNLLQGHTEHRTIPWRREELVRSLLDTVEARCTARTVRASEEEAAIKEYMREIEKYFLEKLRQRLAERNDEDRDLSNAISTSTSVTIADKRLWPPAIPSAPVASSNGISTNLSQFSSLLTDDSLARLVKEISHRLLPAGENAKKLTVTKWPRLLSSMSPPPTSPSSSPMVNGKVHENSSIEEDDEQPLIISTQHFYSFAAVLPNIEPLEFAQLLEQQPGYSPRLRSRSQSTVPRTLTPSMERVHSRTQSPSRGLKEPSPLSVYSTVDVNGYHKKQGVQILPPSTYSTSEFVRGDRHRKSAPTSAVSTPRPNKTSTKARQESQEPAPAPKPAVTQPEPITAEPPKSVSSDYSKRRYSLPTRHRSSSKAPLADTSTESNTTTDNGRRRQLSSSSGAAPGRTTPVSVTAFHFGEGFLTRPIDVRPLGNDSLAVSDSCGGVYITDSRGGKILHHIWLDGNSASSLCYVPSFDEQPQRPPLLLVSVLGKTDRFIRFYETDRFTLLEEVACPKEPDIDMGRSRWLAADDHGTIFMTSGDGKMSALWKFHSSTKPWTLLKVAPNSRYQYLDVMHNLADSTSVTLLTCNGIQGSLMMITVSRAGRILAEQDFSDSYGLDQYIHSPASAVVDHRGNMLILDYSNGKLWILKAPKGNRQGGDRRLKLLTEFGAQQAMGIAVTPTFWQSEQFLNGEQWCYAACFNKKRVHAVKYLSD